MTLSFALAQSCTALQRFTNGSHEFWLYFAWSGVFLATMMMLPSMVRRVSTGRWGAIQTGGKTLLGIGVIAATIGFYAAYMNTYTPC